MGIQQGGRGPGWVSPGLAAGFGGDRLRISGGGRAVDAARVLRYLESTQEADGHWAQNMWLDGRPYWHGLQMDEAAFPILLVDCMRRRLSVGLGDLKRWWKLVRRAAGFLVRNGPVTQQDRWEEDARLFAVHAGG